MDQQLLAYIDQELKRGVRPETVKKALCDAGWESQAVQEAILATQSKAVAPAPKITSAPEEKKEEISFAPASEDKPKKRFSVVKLALGATRWFLPGLQSTYIFRILLRRRKSASPTFFLKGKMFRRPEKLKPAQMFCRRRASKASWRRPKRNLRKTLPKAPMRFPPRLQLPKPNRKLADRQATNSAKRIWWRWLKRKKRGLPPTANITLAVVPPAIVAAVRRAILQNRRLSDCGAQRSFGKNIGDLRPGLCVLRPQQCSLLSFFCYYAKLESGEYYTASHEGNFLRKTAPKIFEECAAAD